MLRKKIIVVTLILLVAWIISDYITITDTDVQSIIQSAKSTIYQLQKILEDSTDQEVIEEEESVDDENLKEDRKQEKVVYDTDNDPIDDTISGWYYDQLTRNEKVIYSAICYDTDIQNEYVKFKGARVNDLARATKAIVADDYYISEIKYDYRDYYEEGSVSIKATIECDVRKKHIRRVEKEADRIIRDEIKEGTEEELIWQIYKYLTKNIKYDDTTKNKHTRDLYGALIKKECVCTGYARAFSYLCNRIEGVKAITVRSDDHEWNYVQLSNKKWYAIDVTWGRENKKRYFMRGTDFLNDHIPRSEFEVPVLNDEALCPDSKEAKKIRAHLKKTISACEINMKTIENYAEYDENDEIRYELYGKVRKLVSEILEKINKSLFDSYINTEEFSDEYEELNSKIAESNFLLEEEN